MQIFVRTGAGQVFKWLLLLSFCLWRDADVFCRLRADKTHTLHLGSHACVEDVKAAIAARQGALLCPLCPSECTCLCMNRRERLARGFLAVKSCLHTPAC